ncbi:aldolase [Coprinopsis marcescibilis]|uniref:Aldolase n=1 Tax=Coprinopsis marcescibilis TaxID=230819 RepID=A0A5C3L6S2_COPMA|nr:aldolase [Coprinopsis marcescibilis]
MSSPATTERADPIKCTRPVTDRSVEDVLRQKATAVLVDSVNSQTLLYHGDVLHGSYLSLEAIACALKTDDQEVLYHAWVATHKIVNRYQRLKAQHPSIQFNPVTLALNQFFVEIGANEFDASPGPHITYIDPRKHCNAEALVAEAQRRFHLLKQRNLSEEEILISMPATEEALKATRILCKQGDGRINVNLFLVSSLLHAAACAEAGASTITIHVRPILEWFERRQGKRVFSDALEHPGVQSIQSILAYFKTNKIKTRIIGKEFRKASAAIMAEIAVLADFDAVCVSEYQLDRLKWNIARYDPSIDSYPTVVLRSKQARYPPNILDQDDRFMKNLSPESRGMIRDIMSPALERLSEDMDTIEAAIVREVKKQFRATSSPGASPTKNKEQVARRHKSQPQSPERSQKVQPLAGSDP